MPRPKTSSITHLVKIVAEEVYHEKFGNFDRLRERIVKLENKKHGPILMDHSEIIHQIRSDLTKAGRYWSDSEDALLIDEIKTAISTIAKNHSRSHGAIVSRILQKELIESNMGE